MLNIIKLNSETIDNKIIDQAVKHLINNGLIIYPTDTSYGLGALLSDNKSIENIYKLKGRDSSKQLSVVAPSVQWIKNNLELDAWHEKELLKYLPGKFTFIFKYQNSIKTLGVRIPNSKFIQMLVKKIGEPITATSANISGQNDCFSLADLQKGILRQGEFNNLDIIIFNAGELTRDQRSTVVDLTTIPPVVLRQGSGEYVI